MRRFLSICIITFLLFFLIQNISYAQNEVEDITQTDEVLESQQDLLGIPSFLREAKKYTNSVY